MADVNAALAFEIYPRHRCFNGSRLGPLDAKRMWKQHWPSKLFANIYVFLMVDVKHRWPLKFFPTPMSFNGECESIVGLQSFCRRLCVLMADVKASLAFGILPTTTCFNGECESNVGLRNFRQHLCVLMANVKASLAFKIFANTYVF